MMPRELSMTSPMEILTSKEAAVYLRVDENTLRHWRLDKRNITFVKEGRFVRYTKMDLDDFLVRHKVACH